MQKFITDCGFTTTTGSLTTGSGLATAILPPQEGVQAVLQTLLYQSIDVADTISLFAARPELETTLYEAATNADTEIKLVADSSGKINGRSVAEDDFLLIETDADSTSINDDNHKEHNFRLLFVNAAPTEAAGVVTCGTCVGLDGHTGLEGTAAVGNRAWLIPAASLRTRTLIGPASAVMGAGQITGPILAAHDTNQPIGVILKSNDGDDLAVIATAEYVSEDNEPAVVEVRSGRLS